MKSYHRLRRSSDIKRVRQIGKSYAHPLLVLLTAPSTGSQKSTRIGVVAGKRVGKAVERNRVKRRIRECSQKILSELPENWDLLFLARRPICQASFMEIQHALRLLVHRANLLENIDGSQSPDRKFE